MKPYAKQLGKGQAIVLIHGWGFDSRVWSGLAEALSEKFQITLIDLPGFGLSAPLTLQHAKQLIPYAQAVLALAPKQASYIGWSLGGLVATAIAAQAPQRVCKLISIASTPKFINSPHWPGMAHQVLEGFKQNLNIDCQQTLQKFAYLITQGSYKQRIVLREITQCLFAKSMPILGSLQATLKILSDYDLRSTLSQLTCPQLHLLGEQDKLIPSAVHIPLQQLLPKAQIQLISGAGHVPFISHQEYVVNAISEFMHA